MIIEFIAHATFRLTLKDGRVIIIDPYKGMSFQGRFNYPSYKAKADYIVITHDHLDHNYIEDISGEPIVVREQGAFPGITIRSYRVWHDQFGGTKFGGAVDMKLIEADGKRLLHMGDCGECLTDAQIADLGKVDVVLIPCGGFYSIDGVMAADIAKRLKARVTIPCHYKTHLCELPIEDETSFCAQYADVTRLEVSSLDPEEYEGVVVLCPKMCI